MKVRPSVKKICKNCKVVRRRGIVWEVERLAAKFRNGRIDEIFNESNRRVVGRVDVHEDRICVRDGGHDCSEDTGNRKDFAG